MDFNDVNVFESATVDTSVIIIKKEKSENTEFQHCLVNSNYNKTTNLNNYISNNNSYMPQDDISEESFVFLSKAELAIKKKIEKISTPLKDWDINIYRGVLTGYNEAFIIDEAKKQQLINEDPKSAEIIKPILRGKDIKRYEAKFAGLYLINSHNGYDGEPRIDINEYPAIKNHLDLHWDKISKRYDKGATPYNLRNCAYLNEFEKEKIVYVDIASEPYFYLDNKMLYTNDRCFIVTGKQIKYLLLIFNSIVGNYLFRNYCDKLGEKGIKFKKISDYGICIPKFNSQRHIIFEQKADEIIKAKEQGGLILQL